MATDHTRAFRVLVVDDEAPIRELVARMLRQPGYEPFVAADEFEAIEMATKQGPFDLLITDVAMPPSRVTNWRDACVTPTRTSRSCISPGTAIGSLKNGPCCGKTKHSWTNRSPSRRCSKRCRCSSSDACLLRDPPVFTSRVRAFDSPMVSCLSTH